ncbi:hypothetical protein Tco_1109162 [Tanacetum coccineum]
MTPITVRTLYEDLLEDSGDIGSCLQLKECTKIPINHVPVAMKSPSIATYKIIKQGKKSVYQIVREDGTDISEWLTGKETSNPFKIFNDSPLTGVNTPGSDENRLKLYDLMYIIVNVADMMDC